MEKRNIFERVRLKTAERKKDETKKRRKTEGVSQGDEKREWKKTTEKKHKDLAKKGEKKNFCFWKSV